MDAGGAGLDGAGRRQERSVRADAVRRRDLAGRKLTPRSAAGGRSSAVRNAAWTSGNAVLLGAAAYNAHHSVGLGVRSGLEDAEALATLIAAAHDRGGARRIRSRAAAARGEPAAGIGREPDLVRARRPLRRHAPAAVRLLAA